MIGHDPTRSPEAVSTPEDLLANLTEPQLKAVTSTEGPVLVLAGAGSGKTRVITRRAAYLAATATEPWHVLAITFTNKAAGEMKERIDALSAGGGMTVCTFHALCVRILRRHHEPAGLSKRFLIVDQSDRRKLVKEAIERANLATVNFAPAKVEAKISRAKNDMVSPRDFAEDARGFYDTEVARIYEVYERILEQQEGVDFDDLLFKTALLLGRCEEVLSELADRYRYVLIDEYQDTNTAQYRIANLLARSHRNLFVTGDPDQSIYGWRGADIDNILSFETDYPDAVVVRLEQNYRSTKRILSAASMLVAANEARKDKTLWTENDEGSRVRVIACDNATDEAGAVIDDITEHMSAGRAASEFAIFYRVNAMSRVYEEAMLTRGVAYRIARGLAFYDRKEVKDVLAYLRLIVNPRDQVSLERIINVPTRGIGKSTVDKLKAFASSMGCSLYEAVGRFVEIPLSKRAAGKVGDFAALLGSLRPLVDATGREALERTLTLSGLAAQLSEMKEINPEPAENVNELINAAVDFDRDHAEATLIDWLSFTSLLGEIDMLQEDHPCVTLMTLHAAKGLEFPVVYIVGVEEGLLPFERFGDSDGDKEEERRLFFVGMTRAKERLVLCHSKWRMMRGASTRTRRSCFLDELPHDEIEWFGQSGSTTNRAAPKPTGELPDDILMWEVGTLVRHPTHGMGQITAMDRGARRTHVSVRFMDGSDRRWVLEFASLERVEFDEVD